MSSPMTLLLADTYVNIDDIMTRKKATAQTYHHGNLPDALIREALALIDEKGVEGFSMREAARNVGVDPAAAYRHFEDKSTLLAAVARQGFSRLAREMEHGQQNKAGAAERFRAVGFAYVNFAATHRAQFRVMFGPYGAGRSDGLEVRGVGARGLTPYEILVEGLSELKRAGLLSVEIGQAALPAWSMVHGLSMLVVDQVWPSQSPETLHQDTERTIAMLLRAFEPPKV